MRRCKLTRLAFVRHWLNKWVSFSPPAFGLLVLAFGALASAMDFGRVADYKISLPFLNKELAWFASHHCNSAALPVVAKMVDICLPICAALLVLFTGTLILWTATERLFGQTSNRSAENQAGARLNLFDRERRRWIIFSPLSYVSRHYTR